jgi:hypothetical protein
MDEIKGYKVFNPDWTCRGKQYTCPGTFSEEGEIEVCEHGMHFCLKAADCFNYYQFNPENHVAEVIAHGQIAGKGDKCCTDKLEIVREIPWQEVLDLVNQGKGCTGLCNSGNRNSGDCNSGNRNSGDWNSGDWNSGDWNSGDWNSGNRNSGNRNSGDWNKTNFSNGCFNTEEPKIYLFNKPSEWTLRDWLNSDARYLLNQIDSCILEYVYFSDMTDEEKKAHPEAETTGGYLKELDKSECGQIWWNGLSESNRDIIRSIPNFDPVIFEQITGIKIEN